MARLPVPSKDSGEWGKILNNFLSVSHSPNGALKSSSVTDASAIVNSSIENDKLDASVQSLLEKADNALPSSEKGVASGIASLNTNGTLTVTQFPSSFSAYIQQDDIRLTNARAPIAHASTHATGEPDELTAEAIGAASETHSHTISDVTSLQDGLDGKADTSHTHVVADLSNASSVGQSILVATDEDSVRSAIDAAQESTLGETIRDTIGSSLVAGSNITITPDDGEDTITISATASASNNLGVIVPDAVGDGIADDTAAIQASLDAANSAGGGVVWLPDGVYKITDILTIGSKTHLRLSQNAIIKRSADISIMIINKSSGDTGVYGASSDIAVSGGTWDFNSSEYTAEGSVIGMCHAERINIDNLSIINAHIGHGIKLCAAKDATISKCSLRDFTGSSGISEMINLSVAHDSSIWSWFGPYDDTPCENIDVNNCTFSVGLRGIGSHAQTTDHPHSNIKITDCSFRDLSEPAIVAYDYTQICITGCIIESCQTGIKVESLQDCSDITISNNILKTMSVADPTAMGIYVNGTDTANRYVKRISISNNSISSVGGCGIKVDYVDQLSVVGNEVYGAVSTGIFIYDDTNVCVNGNTSRTCTDRSMRVSESDDVSINSNIMETLESLNTTRTICMSNHIITSYTAGGGESEWQSVGNYINSVWTP